MVSIRKALERLWKDRCSVIVKNEITDEVTKRTKFVEVPLFENQACKLSFETLTSAKENSGGALIAQFAKLFIAVEMFIPPGSKIQVTKVVDETASFSEEEIAYLKSIAAVSPDALNSMLTGTITINYEKSGEPAVYSHHQEVPLELFKGWA
jgi:hypothetical protein